MFWHVESDVFCLLILLAVHHDIRSRGNPIHRLDRLFCWITRATIVGVVTDVFSALVSEFAGASIWPGILVPLYYAMVLLLPMVWYAYLFLIVRPERSERDLAWFSAGLVPGVLAVLAALCYPLIRWIYAPTPASTRLEWRPVSFAVFAVLCFYCFVTVLILCVNWQNFVPRSRAWIFGALFFLLPLAALAQILLPGMLLIYPSYTVVLVLIHFSIQSRLPMLDGLTGVESRTSGERRINDYIRANPCGPAAFVLTDLDLFKRINDRMGHVFGDEVLKCFAQVLQKKLAPPGSVARLGGDEFIVFLWDYGDRGRLETMLNQVGEAMKGAFVLNEGLTGMSHVTVSMGVALFPENGSNYLELYENADIALYQAKLSHTGVFAFYDPADRG